MAHSKNRLPAANTARQLHGIAHFWLPLLLSCIAMAGSLWTVYCFRAPEHDYGLFTNLFWNLAQGNGWKMSTYAGQVREFFLADHMVLLAPFWALFFKIFPSIYTLAVLHGLVFSAVFFLVPVLAKEIWKESGKNNYALPAIFTLLLLCVSQGFFSAWSFLSHTTTLSIPFVLCALIAGHRKKWLWVVFWCALLCLSEERSAVAVFGVGMYLVLILRNTRLGAFLCLLSCAWFFTVVRLVIPSFYSGSGGYIYSSMISPLADLGKKAKFIFKWLRFWAFLPFAGGKAFYAALCAMPVIGIGLVSGRDAMYEFHHQYHDLPSMFMVASALYGLLWLMEKAWFRRIPRIALLLLAGGILAFSTTRGEAYFYRQWGTLLKSVSMPEIYSLNSTLEKYADIPADITVYTSAMLGPRFSLRLNQMVVLPEGTPDKIFSNSLIFIGPLFKERPDKAADDAVRAFEQNPSVRLLDDFGYLKVFASKDFDLKKLNDR